MKWLVLASAAAAVFARDAPAPAPAGPAEAPEAPAAPKGLKTLHIKFEIMNFNYYDLTKETCPEKVTKQAPKKHKGRAINAKKKVVKEAPAERGLDMSGMPSLPDASLPDADVLKVPGSATKLPWMDKENQGGPATPPKPAPAQKADVDEAIDEIHSQHDSIAEGIRKGFAAFGGGGGKSGLPWMNKKEKSFMQVEGQTQLGACVARQDLGETTSTECTTTMDVLRDTIKETVKGIINCLYMQSIAVGPSPGPAPMSMSMPPVAPASIMPAAPAPASFLQLKPGAPAPSTAEAPAPSPSGPPQKPDVEIFVTFAPGRKVGNGATTIVEVAFLDTPGNGIDDVDAAKPFLVWCKGSGLLNHELGNALATVTGIHPKMHKMAMDTETIEQWNIEKCEKHIKSLVDNFTLHYTRAQVPMALYNECTNFITKMSFSHDYVLDPMDTARCRKATAKLEHKWAYGKNAEEKDFEGMCFHACEAKYGRNAPTCNLHGKNGDALVGQPL